tara:strand:+ start:1254 stop:1496 length:243 start_codon:yes stop_codon:yes gene_type:complete
MNNCAISVNLAYGMMMYIIASIFYLLRTRNIGTPFNDSLTKEQRKIKRESANIRRNVFYQGLLLAAGAIYFIKFEPCLCS